MCIFPISCQSILFSVPCGMDAFLETEEDESVPVADQSLNEVEEFEDYSYETDETNVSKSKFTFCVLKFSYSCIILVFLSGCICLF